MSFELMIPILGIYQIIKTMVKIYAQGLSLQHYHNNVKPAQHKWLTLEERLSKLCISTW